MRTSDGERSKKEGVFGSDAEVPMGEERCWRGCGNREVLVGRGLAWRPSKPARNREMRTDRRGEMSVEKANYAAAKIGGQRSLTQGSQRRGRRDPRRGS